MNRTELQTWLADHYGYYTCPELYARLHRYQTMFRHRANENPSPGDTHLDTLTYLAQVLKDAKIMTGAIIKEMVQTRDVSDERLRCGETHWAGWDEDTACIDAAMSIYTGITEAMRPINAAINAYKAPETYREDAIRAVTALPPVSTQYLMSETGLEYVDA